MEDILDLYALPYDPLYPNVCFDEMPYQLIGEIRQPLPTKPGQSARFDYEYQRNGTVNLFLFFQPLAGWRHAKITQQRTKLDFAQCMKELVDVHSDKGRTAARPNPGGRPAATWASLGEMRRHPATSCRCGGPIESPS